MLLYLLFIQIQLLKNRILIAQENFLMLSDYFTWTGKTIYICVCVCELN